MSSTLTRFFRNWSARRRGATLGSGAILGRGVDVSLRWDSSRPPGQIVNGDPILTLEAILSAAGYEMTLDGQLSAEEQLFLQNFKDKLEDKDFRETANELLEVIAETAEKDVVSIIHTAKAPDLGGSFGNAVRARAIKQLVSKLISDPD